MQELQADDPPRVGPYTLLGRLGAGGMGQVYLGRSPGGRLVAVKLIRADLAGDPGFRARFAREVASARVVSGVFTAAVVDADPEAPLPWLVTSFVNGPSLADTVDNHGALPVPSVLALAAGLAEGLSAVHAAGVVHRDLKPSNVLLAPDGPRVIDFGISQAANATHMTRTGMLIGSPAYMSPEQAEGATVGPASDVFSLGAVLTFAATGEGPFGAGPPTAQLYRVVHGTPHLDHLPALVRPLVERCLVKDPAQRPTARQFLAELTAAHPSAADLTDWLPASILPVVASSRPAPGLTPEPASAAAGQPATPAGAPTPGWSQPAAASGSPAQGPSWQPTMTTAGAYEKMDTPPMPAYPPVGQQGWQGAGGQQGWQPQGPSGGQPGWQGPGMPGGQQGWQAPGPPGGQPGWQGAGAQPGWQASPAAGAQPGWQASPAAAAQPNWQGAGMPGASWPAAGPATKVRRRRWWLIPLVATVAVIGVVAGVIVSLPKSPQPVLRPTGLTADAATASSVTFGWAAPASGPQPDKYEILLNGQQVGTVPGNVTNFKDTGLAPGTAYQFQVVAVRGGKSSPQSTVLNISTVTPPVSEAILAGTFTANYKTISAEPADPNSSIAKPGYTWQDSWTFTLACTAGPCDANLKATFDGYPFNATLTRSGANYTGHAPLNNFSWCGNQSNTVQDTMDITVKLGQAQVQGAKWTATSWSGTVVLHVPYVAKGNCYADTFNIGVTSSS